MKSSLMKLHSRRKQLDIIDHQGKKQMQLINKKSHTWEKGGAHLRISFWHLLKNLKNKLFLKRTVEVGH